MSAEDIRAARADAVGVTIARIRRLADTRGINQDTLRLMTEALLELAAHRELFPRDEFPAPAPDDPSFFSYRLHEDADGSLSLDLNSLNPGNEKPPHDHGTWAVFAAVEGGELNHLYEFGADLPASAPRLRLRRDVLVEPGRGLSMLASEIHSVSVVPGAPRRHLHLYGVARRLQTNGRVFDPKTGAVALRHPTSGSGSAR